MHNVIEGIMNKYWEQAKSREKVQEFVKYQDLTGASVLDYCRIRGRQDILSTIGCFCTDESKIVQLEYKEIPITHDFKFKEKDTVERLSKINEYLKMYSQIENAFKIAEFPYPDLDLKISYKDGTIKNIPRHNTKECIWIDTEEKLSKMAENIMKFHKAIGVDTEYHDIEKVFF